MKPSTEEFLYFLLWTADSLVHPTWRNIHDSFESWAWRKGLGRRLAELERLKLVERPPEWVTKTVVRLTDAGKRVALGGRDPDEQWNRPWDGRWRLVVFDIPVDQNPVRLRLWRHLRSQGFGYLQDSAWITPDPIEIAPLKTAAGVPAVEVMILLKARPCGGETDDAVVRGAWDFERINSLYRQHMNFMRAAPRPGQQSQLRGWACEERRVWREAVQADPLLPRRLLPEGYFGIAAWQRRNEVISRLARTVAAQAA